MSSLDPAATATPDPASSSEPLFDSPPASTSPSESTSSEPGDYRPHGPGLPSIDDYRRLNRSATQWGMYAGCAGGGALAYLSHRRGYSKNTTTLAFLLGGTIISFMTSTRMLYGRLNDIDTTAYAARRPQAEGGGGPLLTDSVAVETQAAPGKLATSDLSGRTRWAKGRGLDGEVEEETEMRDTFFRPGVPRV